MKKALLLFGATAAIAINAANAQQRFSLYEEFSGENCPPCAAVNPGLWTLMNAGTNNDKVLIIKYQTPIPTAGPIYNLYKADADARRSYYGVNFAPWGNMDGGLASGFANAGANNANYNPGYLTQMHIDSSAKAATDFEINATHEWFADGDSVRVNIEVKALNAHTGTNVKLRVALLESLYYEVAPGTNGETEFHNVVRRMYPSAAGSDALNTWTANQVENYTVEGYVPSYIDKNGSVFVAVWLQDDTNKAILQAAKTDIVPVTEDILISSKTTPGILCGSATIENHTVKLINKGTSTVTSADIHYGFAGNMQIESWTGSLAPNDTTEVNIPTITVPASATVYKDSLGLVNNAKEFNAGNNLKTQSIKVFTNPTSSLPIAFNAQSALPSTWTVLNNELRPNAGANDWFRATLPSGYADPFGTNGIIAVLNPGAAGKSSYLALPYANISAGAKALDFWYSYGIRGGLTSDELAVVYSKDCGATWKELWKASGDVLSNGRTSVIGNYFLPKQGEWSWGSVDFTEVEGDAIIAFKSISNDNNYIFLDNIELREGAVSVNTVLSNNAVVVSPNPVVDNAQISFDLANAGKVSIQITNLLGQNVYSVAAKQYAAGNNTIDVSTSKLAAGLYIVNVVTEAGTYTTKMTK